MLRQDVRLAMVISGYVMLGHVRSC